MTRFLQTADACAAPSALPGRLRRDLRARRAHAAPQSRGVLYVRRRLEERRTTFAAKGSARLSGVVMN
ncbi:MAG: hypothetical protein FWD69_11615, partial [Polyangiaceae bacterium]|nr:hypothetical protein [Polyangiaceae bacterium]